MSDLFLFIALPYVAIVVMLVGSVYFYRSQGTMVTSLSSQFMESRQLFYGSLFMHWGIVILFFGHLIGFLLPRSVIAWNGNPVRLLILEVSAFIFGLSFFTGVVILIARRLWNKRLRVVTTDMDIIVFLALFIQAVTGLWIAISFRWGSSWFAVVLSPYLRSLFLLQPDITAVSALPAIVKIHISMAYIVFALIPFTRFMHLLVFPIRYFWRSFQLVFWNRDRSWIRRSRSLSPDVKARNS